jgi:hypothetical protein
VTTVQNKIFNSESLNDNRGKHYNRKNSISETILNDIKEFVNLMHKHESHYIKDCDKLYFENRALTLTEIYKEFQKYSNQKYNTPLSLSYPTFHKIFNEKIGIKFRKPRTDLCDFHFNVEQIGLDNLTEKERNDFLIHNQNVIKYREIKESLLEF